MPKVNHRRGGGGESKHVSSIDDVKARNAGQETAYDKARRRRQGEDVEEDSDDDQQQQQKEQQPRKTRAQPLIAVENPNAVKRDEMKEGVELTRRQREELDKAAARRRYEELHKAGKTDEAKADLARLEEVKKRREEAAKKKAEEEAAAKEKQDKAGEDKPRGALINCLKEAMGTEGRKKKDEESEEEVDEDGEKVEKKEKPKAKKEDNTWQKEIASKKGEDKSAEQKGDGTIEACREIEEDFM